MYDHFKQRPYPDNDGAEHDIEFSPCPFCGDMPHVIPKGNRYTKKRSVTVKCNTCRVQVTNSTLRHGFEWLYEKSAEGWNRRIAV